MRLPATFECCPSSIDLSTFDVALLAKRRQQYDEPRLPIGIPVRDTPWDASAGEPQLEQPVAERTGQWHAQVVSGCAKTIDRFGSLVEVRRRQVVQPRRDLRLDLDPRHACLAEYSHSAIC
jgi:hypothetical protein